MDLEEASINEKEPIVPASANQYADKFHIIRGRKNGWLIYLVCLVSCGLLTALVPWEGLWGSQEWHRHKASPPSPIIDWCHCPGIAPSPYQRKDPLANAYIQNLAIEVAVADQGEEVSTC
jgi:hypothetical protein